MICVCLCKICILQYTFCLLYSIYHISVSYVVISHANIPDVLWFLCVRWLDIRYTFASPCIGLNVLRCIRFLKKHVQNYKCSLCHNIRYIWQLIHMNTYIYIHICMYIHICYTHTHIQSVTVVTYLKMARIRIYRTFSGYVYIVYVYVCLHVYLHIYLYICI